VSTAAAWLLVVQLAASGAMTGIIWFVQVVHYPLLAEVGPAEAVDYELRNTHLTTFVVLPPMVVELVCGLLLVAARPAHVAAWLAWTGLALIAAAWASTGLIQVPAHRILSERASQAAVRSLVRGNWIRTAAWSARLGVAAAMLLLARPGA
jgi:uncharacterized membrane protein